jgi:hypothetical protein
MRRSRILGHQVVVAKSRPYLHPVSVQGLPRVRRRDSPKVAALLVVLLGGVAVALAAFFQAGGR